MESKRSNKQKRKIPNTPKWASRKALSNSYIASAVQHFRTTESIDCRIYFITAHKEVRAGKNKTLPSNRAICTDIYKKIVQLFSTTYEENQVELTPQDKPGMILCSDASGTRSDGNQINFNPREKPHIHALLFLPFEIGDDRTDRAFMHKVAEIIRGVDGIRKSNIGTSNGSVLVEKFVPNTPLWWVVDYSIKAERISNSHQEFQPLVFPYQQILGKYELSSAKTDVEHQRFDRKRNAVLAGQTRALQKLTYDPEKFYKSDMCCDFSTEHRDLLEHNRKTQSVNYIPSPKEENQIIGWRGSFDGTQCGNLTPISSANTNKPSIILETVQPTEWGVSLDGYIDESACRAALGKSVNPPSIEQDNLMPDSFLQSPSEHAWLKTQTFFHQRLAYWRLYFRLFPLAKNQKHLR